MCGHWAPDIFVVICVLSCASCSVRQAFLFLKSLSSSCNLLALALTFLLTTSAEFGCCKAVFEPLGLGGGILKTPIVYLPLAVAVLSKQCAFYVDVIYIDGCRLQRINIFISYFASFFLFLPEVFPLILFFPQMSVILAIFSFQGVGHIFLIFPSPQFNWRFLKLATLFPKIVLTKGYLARCYF